MKSIWKATYVGNEIRIENTWGFTESDYMLMTSFKMSKVIYVMLY
ncbi:hypothetical protein [Capnocytophaga cynodegmi]|nr:hypothetical protein [Capnocytophaga cynodegmi]